MQISLCFKNTMYETEGNRLRDNIVDKLAFEKHYKNKIQKFLAGRYEWFWTDCQITTSSD